MNKKQIIITMLTISLVLVFNSSVLARFGGVIEGKNGINQLLDWNGTAFSAGINISPEANTLAVATANFNNDSYIDYAEAIDGTFINIYLGNSGNTFTKVSVPDTRAIDLKAVDIDNDRDIDLLCAWKNMDNSYGIQVLVNDGTGGFTRGTNIGERYNNKYKEVLSFTSGDVTENGFPDLIIGYRFVDDGIIVGNIAVYSNNGHGEYSYLRTIGHPLDYSQAHNLASGDINNDGKADIAVLDGNSTSTDVIWYLNTGSGSFGVPNDDITGYDLPADGTTRLYMGYLNNDDLPDFLLGNSLQLFLNFKQDNNNDYRDGRCLYDNLGNPTVTERMSCFSIFNADSDDQNEILVGYSNSNSLLINLGPNGELNESSPVINTSNNQPTQSLGAFFKLEYTIDSEMSDATPVPPSLDRDIKNGRNGFFPPANYNVFPSDTPVKQFSASRLLEDTANGCYYRLTGYSGTGIAGKSFTDEELLNMVEGEIEKVDIPKYSGSDLAITWEYEKVIKITLLSDLAIADPLNKPKQCYGCGGIDPAPASCAASGSTCDTRSDETFFYAPNKTVVLMAKDKIEEDQFSGFIVAKGSDPVTHPDVIDVWRTAILFIQKNTEIIASYSNPIKTSIGKPITGYPVNRETSEITLIFKYSPDSTVENAFYWSQDGTRLYPIRPEPLFSIKTKDEPEIFTGTATLWPDHIQTHIIGATANLNKGSDAYEFKKICFSEENEAETAVNGGVYNPTKTGKNLLLFEKDNDIQFLAVENKLINDALAAGSYETIPIGSAIVPELAGHVDPERKNGFVYYENAFYDGVGPKRAYNRETREGQIIPVNISDGNTVSNQKMVVVWYNKDPSVSVGWPVKAVEYRCQWPESPETIDIISGNGSGHLEQYESAGTVYNQPDQTKPGFNPNEEHSFIMGDTLYALRNDLNYKENHSQPYVLLKYQYEGEWTMRVFKAITSSDFQYEIIAGQPIVAPKPLNLLPAVQESHITSGEDFYFRDHKGGHWAKAEGQVTINWYYPLQPGFYYPKEFVNQAGEPVVSGDAIPFLSRPLADNKRTSHTDPPIDAIYNISWPEDAPKLYTGETLMKARYGLPDIAGMAAAQVIFDEELYQGKKPLAKLYAPLSERSVELNALPDGIKTTSIEGKLFFSELKYSLKSRLFYNPLNKKLIFKGTFNDKGLGESLLLSNVMTISEKEVLKGFDDKSGSASSEWDTAINTLFDLTRNPNQIEITDGMLDLWTDMVDDIVENYLEAKWGILLGLEVKFDSVKSFLYKKFPLIYSKNYSMAHLSPIKIIGETMALTAGMSQGEGWVVLAENNDESLGSAPVSLHVIRVGDGPYRGEVKVIKSDNVFDEKLTLRHTGDFAGEPEKVYFKWYYKPDSNGIPPKFPENEEEITTLGWIAMGEEAQGWGKNDTTIEGASLLTLSDNWIMCRYYYGSAYPQLAIGTNIAAPGNAVTDPDNWSGWAGGPGNQTAQLAEGWIKRVVDDLNPLETRVTNFRENETNTLVSMISQLGGRYEGAVAMNSSPENLNSIGLIEAYNTILDRGEEFSINNGSNYGPANNALLNAATRLAGFYTLLGNEAYADAVDPTIGFDTQAGSYGAMMPSIFAFQNQLDSLLEEELVLLRGRNDTMSTTRATPVYNRLIWNYTRDIGEVAYATCYNISDMDNSGVINEYDAQTMYPQGHGDAWGHYLTAMKYWYSLLRHENFTWEPRIEAVLVGGAPVPVDYLDERKFAETAAAKAKMGSEIVNMTYRKHYVDDPTAQWQGYKDTETERAWGVDGWARRAGQAAYFDWVTANALLPFEDPNPDHQGLNKIDRTTVGELKTITAEYRNIQSRMDESDNGLNPVGLAKGVVPFDIDPSLVTKGKTHFDQIKERAIKALANAGIVFEYANNYTRIMRENEDSLDGFKNNLEDQERDYMNRLIEIFGYPYEGDIGTGGFYPAGYEGPDWVHFMYMDLPDLTGEIGDDEKIKEYTTTWNFDNWCYDNNMGITHGEKEVSYKISENGIYFSKPGDWGKRRAPGEIQMALSDMIQAEIAFKRGMDEYKVALGNIEDAKEILEARHNVNLRKIEAHWLTSGLSIAMDYTHISLFSMTSILDGMIDGLDEGSKVVINGIPRCVGTATDATAPIRGTIEGIEVAGTTTLTVIKKGLEVADEINSVLKEQLLREEEFSLFIQDERFEVKQLVMELEGSTGAAIARLSDCLILKEALQQCQGSYYRSLARGERLLTEREVIRTRAAADVQEYRYQDLGFRVFRNDALQKYRASFDLAARYIYLAATAYDYEINLLGDDAGSGREFLTDIIRQRALGAINKGLPLAGQPGLADPLARLEQNFDVYKTQLGFNNPQTETNRFSLRTECFRIKEVESSNNNWRQKLEECRVDDLWEIPEFKRYCRPFAPESMGAQPGIVIPFETIVTFGKNYFGKKLSGGDSAYDPTNFATKIRSAGVWFSNYDISGLSNTPRIYLVPVGEDVLRSSSGDGFNLRRWHVVDQKLPVPFPIGASDLANDNWIPQNDSLSGEMAAIRRISSFRAYHDSGSFNENETVSDSRLIGRSVWNTKWLLIIPGGTLLSEPDQGLDTFVENVSDIKLFFQTYSYSGN